MDRQSIRPMPAIVERLDRDADLFAAVLENGDTVRARRVVVAVGMRNFAYVPPELAADLPDGSFDHTCELVDFREYRGRRILIVGGRQSAFEWAALLRDAGAAAIEISYRHDTPAFDVSDWSWVTPLVERTRTDGGWYRRLPELEKQAIACRMWQEGRARLEPWLKPRIQHDSVRLWPNTRLRECDCTADRALRVELDTGPVITVDHVILATGYKVDLGHVPFLRQGNVWSGIALRDGYPELDENLQTTQRGLYITGQPAAQDFGPFFGFTVAVRASAERIGRAVSDPASFPAT